MYNFTTNLANVQTVPKAPNIPVRRKKKIKLPVVFCRPGIPQLKKKELDLEIQMASMKISERVFERFEDMNLKQDILLGIVDNHLERPAYIQQRAIVPCIQGKDAIVQAQSGMGKTAALVISVLQRIDRSNPKCQALIMVPTRELAEQMQQVVKDLSKNMMPMVSSFVCSGGRSVRTCQRKLAAGVQIVIGTVGRTVHMLLEGNNSNNTTPGPCLILDSLKTFALDEADEMLHGGYGRDLTTILEKIPPPQQCQVILMSATMPGPTLKLAWRFMNSPLTFLVKDFQLTLDGIQQYHIGVDTDDDKLSSLLDLFDAFEGARGMIFCQTKRRAEQVFRKVTEAEFEAACMTGDLGQAERDEVMEKFRSGEPGFRIIITSDLLGRGIDVSQINLVINYDLPKNKETYIHRVGRAGRYGRKGVALTFVMKTEEEEFQELQKFYQTIIPPMPPKHQFQQIIRNC